MSLKKTPTGVVGANPISLGSWQARMVSVVPTSKVALTNQLRVEVVISVGKIVVVVGSKFIVG